MLRVEGLKLLNGKTVNFSLNEGESMIIRGNNGSGKSLFLKSLARLLPIEFTAFEYQQKEIKNFSPEQYRSEVLYVSPYPHFTQDMTIEEFFKAPLKLKVYQGHTSSFDYRSYLKKWNIPEGSVLNLSTGQKQLISILRSFTLKPKVLLLDEPTANLDHEKTLAVESLLSEFKGSLLLVSHSEEQAKRLGKKVIEFEDLRAAQPAQVMH